MEQATCATCGRPLTQVGQNGECLRCLVNLGFLNEGEPAENQSPRRLTPGTLKYDHFEVEIGPDGFPVELGAGAMAITYRARDTVLKTTVALKVIDRRVAGNSAARSRFLREARAAAQIRHPNVARVSHYGEQDGECFYVMELVQGETLEERVRKSGPMPLALALDVTEQTARALAAAEACGVVHRDLKPSNIMLESDVGDSVLIKVIDYGVAKVLAPQTLTVDQTQPGFIGTPAFASPEQFVQSNGETRVDNRSDIYSLGATLWYLLTGRVPFLAGSMEAIRTKQEKALPVEDLKKLRMPTQVVNLLKSMLAPDPKDRPQSARELISHLHGICTRFNPEARTRHRRTWITGGLLSAIAAVVVLVTWLRQHTQPVVEGGKSIAVLPFENLSSNAGDAYFAAGIQDEILTKLANVADLKVISRTSTDQYKSKPTDLKTVGRQLGVANILEGSVQRVSDKVRVNVQLIDTRSDTHVWANTYDRDLKDVLAVESEISQSIASALKAKLSSEEANRLASVPTENAEAYDLFLKGEYALREANILLKAEPFDRAALFYQQALVRDPAFSPAAARLVVSRIRRHFFISSLSEPELDEIKQLAEQTVAAAPNLPDAHIALAAYYYLGHRQYDRALKELQRALELQPNHITALEMSAYMHRRQGEWQRGISEMEKCEELDPRNPELAANIAGAYCSLRQWKAARRAALHTLALDPNSTLGLQTAIIVSLNESGKIDEAKRLVADYPQPGRVAAFTVIASSRSPVFLKVLERDFAGALKLYESEIDDPAENRARLATRAAIHILGGDTSSAREETAVARDLLESRLLERPEDAPAMLQLSWVNLALGRKAEALQLARQAIALVPVEKDAVFGPTYLAALAEIQACAGESDEAVKTLRQLLAMPIGLYVSIQQLKINPVWDPIRTEPGFQLLLTGSELVGPIK